MKIAVYPKSTLPRQEHFLKAFAEGASKFDEVQIIDDQIDLSADVGVILWAPKIVPNYPCTIFRCEVFQEYRKRNKNVVIIEQPILRIPEQHKFYQMRVGLNDVTRLGEYANQNCPSDRWNALNIKIHPWKKRGSEIVIIGQLPGDYSLDGIDIYKWAKETAMELRQHTDRPIKFKPHPRMPKKIPKGFPAVSNFDWNKVWCTVTYSSGMCTDSLIAGVPTITTSPRSFAWDYTIHELSKIEEVGEIEREPLLYNLAYAQWSIGDMKRGKPWKKLRGACAEK